MKTIGTIAGMVLAIAGISGLFICEQNNQNETKKRQKETAERLAEDSADFLEKNINGIAIYQRFTDGRYGVNYETLTNVCGIKRDLPKNANKLPVHVEVIPRGECGGYQTKQSLDSFGGDETDRGGVRIDVPYDMANDVLGRLEAYKNEQLGIKPRPIKDFINPPGEY